MHRNRATVAVALVACSPVFAQPAAAANELSRSDRRWVRSSLANLSLAERAAQMVMVRVFGRYEHAEAPDRQALVAQLRGLRVGGLVVFDSELESLPRLLNTLQSESHMPLLVAADMERSMAFRLRHGVAQLPYAMAIGATRSLEMARFAGEMTAREGRALGVHWALAPVVDINVDPLNPIIDVRSYGEDPELVAEMGVTFLTGVRAGGMLTAVKHFPGHGDTSIDSHIGLPSLDADLLRLESVELVPFRRAIAAGVDAVMSGHVAVPTLDASGAPASLSPPLTRELLRERLGFRGLVVTDALEMAALRPAWTGEAAVRAVRAGADVLLLPRDPEVAVQSLVRAVQEGQLDAARLEEAARRILEAKARLGLHRQRLVDADALRRHIGRPQDLEAVEAMAAASITVVRNDEEVLPLHAEADLRLLHIALASRLDDRTDRGLTALEIEERRIPSTNHLLGPEISPETEANLLAEAAGASHVVISAFVDASGPGGDEHRLTPAQGRLLGRLDELDRPLIVLSLGTPYLLAELPRVDAYLCTFGPAASSQRAAVAALFGERAVRGRLPVTLPGAYPYGHGLTIPRREMSLRRASAESVGFRPGAMPAVDRVLDEYLQKGAYPGGVVAVGRRGALVHLRPFGHLSPAANAPAVAADTIYDLSSLTKVVAATTMAMILVDEERLDLDKTVQDFLPLFLGTGKEQVTVRHLLTHSSGLDWWAPLFREAAGKQAYVERIQAMDLVYEPGSRSLYSDLGVILLGEILERVAGESLDRFVARRILDPLAMEETFFRPRPEYLPRIAPTEKDEWRGRTVHGEVHDENAFALGGVAPHAGLFGTAGDLARFAQMILNGGVLEHRRLISRRTVEAFTRRAAVPDSSRALGWDTRSASGYSSAGSLFSDTSFGHTGFTGTSLWIDPERELFVILLTNRVHPTRANNLVREARSDLADAVVRGLSR